MIVRDLWEHICLSPDAITLFSNDNQVQVCPWYEEEHEKLSKRNQRNEWTNLKSWSEF